MHEYLMEIDHYFGSPKRFQVVADTKEEAIEKAKETSFYKNDDCLIKSSLRVVKKLKPSFV